MNVSIAVYWFDYIVQTIKLFGGAILNYSMPLPIFVLKKAVGLRYVDSQNHEMT